MTPETEAVLDRFHRALVAEIRSVHPEYLDHGFTVAEIYQNLVPYRSHRDVIGVEMNGDYEDALLRLLGGEGGYLLIESDPAREEIQAELASKHPNTGLYRDFAAVGVRLNPVSLDPVAEAGAVEPEFALFEKEAGEAEGDPSPELPESSSDEAAELSENGRTAVAEDGGEVDEERAEPDEGVGDDAHVEGLAAPDLCPSCAEELPAQDNLRFCPYCGGDVRLVPCSECGQPLESDWRFCIACGTSAGEH